MLLISALDLGYNQRELLWLHPIFRFTHFTAKELQVKPQKLRSDKPEPLTKQMLNMAIFVFCKEPEHLISFIPFVAPIKYIY